MTGKGEGGRLLVTGEVYNSEEGEGEVVAEDEKGLRVERMEKVDRGKGMR